VQRSWLGLAGCCEIVGGVLVSTPLNHRGILRMRIGGLREGIFGVGAVIINGRFHTQRSEG
jgi:hypothetical protein